MPNLSIITATYNAADTLVACLDSVRKQSIDVEHILIDGGSTDDTLAIADSYKEHIAKIVSGPDQGIYDAMNKGIGMATGDVIGILNADDYYPSNDVLSPHCRGVENSSIQASYGDLVYVEAESPIRSSVTGKPVSAMQRNFTGAGCRRIRPSSCVHRFTSNTARSTWSWERLPITS